MSEGTRLSLKRANVVASRFLKLIEPHVLKAEIAGSVRRRCSYVGDIEIVVIENNDNPLVNVFGSDYKGMVVNGKRLKRFKYPEANVQIELYISQPYDYGRILSIRTGSSAYAHIKLATKWNRLGYCGTEHGLRKKKDCIKQKSGKWVVKKELNGEEWMPPVFDTEYSFYEFLGIPYISPEDRNWVSKHSEINYSK